ncbi:MAG: alpha/beta fold hydrolase [Bacteroidota bacterium]
MTTTRQLCLIFCLALCIPFSHAQKRQGNIVEYFGKEKINEIKEGKALHTFNKGLYVGGQRSALNSITFPRDPIFSTFLMTDKTVREGETAFVDAEGKSRFWQTIDTDDTSTFSDPKLRGAYVFLTYRSSKEQKVLFEASGHTNALINGFPHEGDYYDFGYSLIPTTLKKGTNVFLLRVGRFPRIRARLIAPKTNRLFTQRDMTLPDLLIGEDLDYKGAIRIINNTNEWIKGYQIKAQLQGESIVGAVPAIAPMTVLKVPFTIPFRAGNAKKGDVALSLTLQDNKGETRDKTEFDLNIKSRFDKHKRTFISEMDGSVQYFAVTPSSDHELENGALFLSVHGASVEATNQANAYSPKDWGTVVAPTNRRPFGFAWEDWGRLDAMEVLAEGKRIYGPDPQKIYLTGHSMGGHGSWYLGATYPDHFAAIAPCAGYPDLLGYRDSFVKRALRATEEERKQWGITPKRLAEMQRTPQYTQMDSMILRAGNPSRTLQLKRNYLQQGIYVLHGEKDNVVPTFIAREMREVLGKFHADFAYYEYPGGTHWYGNHSMDWPPIFDMFKRHSIPVDSTITKMEFHTASPGVSARSHFITLEQQQKPFDFSSVDFDREHKRITTQNVNRFSLNVDALELKSDSLSLDEHVIVLPKKGNVSLKKDNGSWKNVAPLSPKEKGPHRNGGFKDAFRRNMIFVYATKGTLEENIWYYNKARLDAETFYYRANGKVRLVPDTEFNTKDYPDRNVVLYGNSDTNAAWKKLLKEAPVQVSNGKVRLGNREVRGDQWGMYFVYPRADSNVATIGVVAATGNTGMKAIYPNHYLINGTTFPDLLLFSDGVLEYGSDAVKCAGFFGNNWSLENGDFQWK